jgi:subtilisin family serine protease
MKRLNLTLQATLLLGCLLCSTSTWAQTGQSSAQWNAQGLWLLHEVQKLNPAATPTDALYSRAMARLLPVRPLGQHSSGKPSTGVLARVEPRQVDMQALNALQVQVNSRIGDIWSLLVPLESLHALAAVGGIRYVEADVAVRTTMDNVARDTRALEAFRGTDGLPRGFAGQGVIVGAVDGGFDFGHVNFRDTSNTRLRIRRVWDQGGNGTPGGLPPAQYPYGIELRDSAFMLNYGRDYYGGTHGTHVVGIAAGSGLGSPRRFQGMAPNADLVMVSFLFDRPNYPLTGFKSSVLDGVSYIFNYADSVNKPAVVNLSLGTRIGPKDGTSLLDRAYEMLVGAKPGRVVVGSAGNDAEEQGHILHTFNNDTVRTVCTYEFYNNNFKDIGGLELWGDSAGRIGAQLVMLDGSGVPTLQSIWFHTDSNYVRDTALIPSAGDTLYITATSVKADAGNGKPNLLIRIQNKGTQNTALYMTAPTGQRIHAWNDGVGNGANFRSYVPPFFFLNGYTDGDGNYSVGEVGGTSRGVITVAAHTSKNSYRDAAGLTRQIPFMADSGAIAPFSSRGPTTDGRIKPDISAPGNAVESSLANYNMNNFPGNLTTAAFDYGGRRHHYGILQGTSMSAPAVTGAIALLLEADPNLTFAQVKALLQNNARADSWTGNVSATNLSTTWGAGKLDILAALQDLLGVTATGPKAPAESLRLWPNPVREQLYLTLPLQTSEPLLVQVIDLQGRVVFTTQLDEARSLNVAALPAGVYALRVNAPNAAAWTGRFVKP